MFNYLPGTSYVPMTIPPMPAYPYMPTPQPQGCGRCCRCCRCCCRYQHCPASGWTATVTMPAQATNPATVDWAYQAEASSDDE